jgi:F-box protein 9
LPPVTTCKSTLLVRAAPQSHILCSRPGLSEDAWMNVNHLITYHRYLRFYPNGQVLHLLANEELSPKEAIPLMKPTLRMKGFAIGNWYLEGTTLNIVNLFDASGQYALPEWSLSEAEVTAMYRPHLISTPEGGSGSVTPTMGQGPAVPIPATLNPRLSGRGSSVDGPPQARYIFDMTLEIKSRPLGRWNKLEMLTYDSIQLETGDVSPFPLKNERPFWFSKVKSYGGL